MLLLHPQWLRAQWHVQSYWSLLTQSGVAQQPWQQQYKASRKSAPVTVWGAAPVFLFLRKEWMQWNGRGRGEGGSRRGRGRV